MKRNDELMHYGVLGMKWGTRRAAKKGTEYSYKSHGQKKYEKKVNEYEKKVNASKGKKSHDSNKERLRKNENKLELYKIRDKNRVEYAKTTNTGKAFVRTCLLGPIGNGTYSRYKASGNRTGAAFVKSLMWDMTMPVGPAQLMSRHREMNTARAELNKRNNK